MRVENARAWDQAEEPALRAWQKTMPHPAGIQDTAIQITGFRQRDRHTAP